MRLFEKNAKKKKVYEDREAFAEEVNEAFLKYLPKGYRADFYKHYMGEDVVKVISPENVVFIMQNVDKIFSMEDIKTKAEMAVEAIQNFIENNKRQE